MISLKYATTALHCLNYYDRRKYLDEIIVIAGRYKRLGKSEDTRSTEQVRKTIKYQAYQAQQGRNQDLNLAKQKYETLSAHKNRC